MSWALLDNSGSGGIFHVFELISLPVSSVLFLVCLPGVFWSPFLPSVARGQSSHW